MVGAAIGGELIDGIGVDSDDSLVGKIDGLLDGLDVGAIAGFPVGMLVGDKVISGF